MGSIEWRHLHDLSTSYITKGVWGHSPYFGEVLFHPSILPGEIGLPLNTIVYQNIMDKRFRFNQSIFRETVKIPAFHPLK